MSTRTGKKGRPAGAEVDPTLPDDLATWPYLVRIELLVALATMVVLTVWSITVDAPLESPADPTRTPDPSKAPWYFLGLQELLVYFDPWIAGVMIPALIIGGLMAIPYVDPNPRGNGYYTFSQRPFAVTVFLLGFLGLWVVPILAGTFCRGPGWSWVWPWQSWEGVEPPAHTSLNLHDLFGVSDGPGAFAVGAMAVGAWYGLGLLYYLRRRATPTVRALGPWRFALVAFLLLSMAAIPVKIALRLFFDVHYIWMTPWFNV